MTMLCELPHRITSLSPQGHNCLSWKSVDCTALVQLLPHPHLLPFRSLHSRQPHVMLLKKHKHRCRWLTGMWKTHDAVARWAKECALSRVLVLVYSYLLLMKYRWQNSCRHFCCPGSTHTNRIPKKLELSKSVSPLAHVHIALLNFWYGRKAVELLRQCLGEQRARSRQAVLSRTSRMALGTYINVK